MLFRDVVTLIRIDYVTNNRGNVLEIPTEKQVFANRKSVRQNEFYQAQSTGLRPELMFEVRTVEYEGEKKLSYNGKEYSIIRSYDKNGEITELIVEGIVNNGNS